MMRMEMNDRIIRPVERVASCEASRGPSTFPLRSLAHSIDDDDCRIDDSPRAVLVPYSAAAVSEFPSTTSRSRPGSSSAMRAGPINADTSKNGPSAADSQQAEKQTSRRFASRRIPTITGPPPHCPDDRQTGASPRRIIPIREIFFQNGGVASVTAVMHDGAMVEIATIGDEGLVGIDAFLGSAT